MPGSLDSCINNVFEDGNIPASSGTTPVRVTLPPTNSRIVLEAASAAAVQDWSVATATERQIAVAAFPTTAFIHTTAARQIAVAPGMIINE